MKTIVLALSLFGSVPLFAAQITLAVGEQKTVPLPGKGTVVVSNSQNVNVKVAGGKARVTGKKPGVSQITAGGRDPLRLTVYSAKLIPVLDPLRDWISEREGLSYSVGPRQVKITGTALRVQDWKDLTAFKRKFGRLVDIEAKAAPHLLPVLVKDLNEDFSEHSITSAKAVVRDGGVMVLSSAKSKSESQTIRKVATGWGAESEEQDNGVELRPMVEVDIVIAEVRKTKMTSLGLQLPGSYSATVLPAPDLGSATTTFSPFNVQLNTLLSEGSGKVLANPKLLCRSGEAAHFIAGGEIPIKISNWKRSDILWKNYGVILDINPVADLNGSMSTKIVTEVSLLDEAHKIDGIPGLLTNRIETHFDLESSKTIALSGLIKSEIGRQGNTTPLLGQIPILGELFNSHDYKNNRTELVVFVTPKVISPQNPPPPPAMNFWSDDDD